MRCKYIRVVGATFFQRRINADTDTFIAVSRPVGYDKTVAYGGVALRGAKRYGFLRTLEPGNRNNRIRNCVNAPLKKREVATVFSAPSNRDTAITVSVGAPIRL